MQPFSNIELFHDLFVFRIYSLILKKFLKNETLWDAEIVDDFIFQGSYFILNFISFFQVI